ncbi:hypothetical protein imdm_1506 [gamma proteobacterium IMCC2047]|nr:hypothetical protein imdm_1506 [gamma proteobacterium IMCC2047]
MHASEALLQAAESEAWDQLSKLANERDLLIRAYFSKPVTVDNAIQIRDKIQRLLAIDDQVLGLARKEQQNLMPAMKAFSQNKKAINAYQQVNG